VKFPDFTALEMRLPRCIVVVNIVIDF